MEEDQLCLHWNDFQPTLTSAFAELRVEEAFVDVTLACEGRQVQAHKLVLSACSPFFRELLQRNPCQHPIIILQDVRFQDLAAIVDFVYRGEVYIRQENLNSFLQAAAQLKIYGLAKEDYCKNIRHDGDDSDDAEEDDPSHPSPALPVPNPPQIPQIPPIPNHHRWSPPKKRPRPVSPPTHPSTPSPHPPPPASVTDLKIEPHDLSHMLECTLDGEAPTQEEKPPKRGGGGGSSGGGSRKRNPVLCPICSKSLSRMDHLRSHLMYIHSGMTPKALCKFCNRVFKNAESLRSHIGLYHKGRRRRQGNNNGAEDRGRAEEGERSSPTLGDSARLSPSNAAASSASGDSTASLQGDISGDSSDPRVKSEPDTQ